MVPFIFAWSFVKGFGSTDLPTMYNSVVSHIMDGFERRRLRPARAIAKPRDRYDDAHFLNQEPWDHERNKHGKGAQGPCFFRHAAERHGAGQVIHFNEARITRSDR